MERERFAPNCPGDLVGVTTRWGGDLSFLPHPLPPSWKFPESSWPLLGDAKQQVGMLGGLGRNLPNPAILLRPLADREAIRSSSLEGTYASPRELLLFELRPRESTSERDPTNDQREVFNYRLALNHGVESELPISLRLLTDLHRLLLRGVRGRDRAPGEFRKIPVSIGSDGRFIPPPPQNLMECLGPLEKYFHVEGSTFDPLVDCFLVHYQFETIHPFVDGNGRVGRLLLAIMLQQRCGLAKPWLYMSEYFEQHKEEYIANLFNVSAKGDWKTWIDFCLRGTIRQAQSTISRCERLLQVRDSFLQRISNVGGSLRLHEIVEGIFVSPFVRVADLHKQLNVTYPTAKSDVDRLVKAGILQELPNIWPKTLYCPEVYQVAYEELDE